MRSGILELLVGESLGGWVEVGKWRMVDTWRRCQIGERIDRWGEEVTKGQKKMADWQNPLGKVIGIGRRVGRQSKSILKELALWPRP